MFVVSSKPDRKTANPPQVDGPRSSVMAPPPQPQTPVVNGTEVPAFFSGGLVSPVNLRAGLSQHCASVSHIQNPVYLGFSSPDILII